MNYEVPQELIQKVIDYLGSKPFVEVHQLLAGLLHVKPAAPVAMPKPERPESPKAEAPK